ncbi:MAG: MaoC family dehydratase [Proteobacteria bacterium]|nr:MaoC family dehydratase [Pseudomonadota bacterium]
MLHFEDFSVGQRFALGPYNVTKEEIIEFAREFDPQPHHLDEDAAKTSMLGGLSASGWHTSVMAMRMFVDGLLNNTATRGGAGVEDARWIKPVRPDDVLRMDVEVIETRAGKRKLDFGYVKCSWTVFNQREQVAKFIVSAAVLHRGVDDVV